MTGSYRVNRGMEDMAGDISVGLREGFGDAVFPVVLVDRTCFSGQSCRYQTDTYQVYSPMERGYITVNVHLFQADVAAEVLSVKVGVFPPVKDTSSRARKIFRALETLLLSCREA